MNTLSAFLTSKSPFRFLLGGLVALLICQPQFTNAQSMTGAWTARQGDERHLLLAADNYLSFTTYDGQTGAFHRTWGGSYATENGQITVNIEFDSGEAGQVGNSRMLAIAENGNQWVIGDVAFFRVDHGHETPLAGCWRIAERADASGVMQPMPQTARKTLKLLSGTHFQWIAMNTETGEFSGTGGGEYTLANGKYTETIRFFSRDNSRVGATLSFEAEVTGNEWIHSGMSSKGQPIKEIWRKVQ